MADPIPTDLEIIRGKASVLLMDTNHKSWDVGTLDQVIRMALADLGRSAGAALTIGGLDGATTTTVDGQDQACLLIGVAAYAAMARSLDLSEKISLGEGPQTTMVKYAESMMSQFQELLGKISRRAMNLSTTAPYGTKGWNLETEPENQVTSEEEEEPAQEAEIMEREARNLSILVLNGAAVSSVIDSTWAAAQGLKTPAALEANTKIGFQVAEWAGGTFLPLYDEYNLLVEMPVTLNAARAYALPEKVFAWPYFKLWCENAGSDVLQTADRSFVLVQKS